ncbi:unnamed protein product [Sphagnum jensenii]|uniref:C3H1-type domain-containing protein n=1 Tax=Sphagnum jensenii TaxID=128206 RepID=A0ABP0X4B7_9BRYO
MREGSTLAVEAAERMGTGTIWNEVKQQGTPRKAAAPRLVDMAAKLEEAVMSSRLEVAWDLSTPAAFIVAKLREKDLREIQALELKCKDQMVPLAFKLAKGLKLVPLVALLLVGRGAVLNSVAKKAADPGGMKKVDTALNVGAKQVDSLGNLAAKKLDTPLAKKVEPTPVSGLVKKVEGCDDCPGGTLVDLVLGMALAHPSSCPPTRFADKLGKPKSFTEEGEATWMEGPNLHSLSDFDGGMGFEIAPKWLEDWKVGGGGSDSEHLKDFSKWDENFTAPKPRQDADDWEEVTSKSRKKSVSLPGLKDMEDKLRKTLSCGGAETENATNLRFFGHKTPTRGDDPDHNCAIARKLLECLLEFRPRLSAHAQSPFLPPLLRAAQASNEFFVSLLLDAGAPVNDRDVDGNTALHWALRQATPLNRRTVNAHVVSQLLEAGASVTIGNKLGATPVHTAAGHGHFEALSLILDKDAGGVNVMAATKETPLHYAVKNNHVACSYLLLKHGANRNVASLRNQKPLQLAPSVEMRVLLTMDDKIIKEQSWEGLKEMLVQASSPVSPLFSLNYLQPQSPFPSQFPSIADSTSKSYFPSSFSQVRFPQSSSVSSQIGSSSPLQLFQPNPSSSLSFSESVSRPPVLSQSYPFSRPLSQDGNPFDWLTPQIQSINGQEVGRSSDRELIKETVNLPQYKTVMCRFYTSSEGCGWGSKCHFAHSEEELMSADRIDSSEYRIGASQGDINGDQLLKNFKTKLCTHNEKTGKCPHGSKCTFAHGPGELRGTLFAPSSARPIVKTEPKPAEIAVQRHYLPFRGKKVEVKRAMARIDYGDEPKLNSPTSPTGNSSYFLPTAPGSGSLRFSPSSPAGETVEEVFQVPQQAWSLPPLAVDSGSTNAPADIIHTSSRNTSTLFPERNILPQGSPYNSSHLLPDSSNHPLAYHSAPTLSQNEVSRIANGSFPVQDSGNYFHSFGHLFPQSSSHSLDSVLATERGSFLEPVGASLSRHPFISPSHPHSMPGFLHSHPLDSVSLPYSNGNIAAHPLNRSVDPGSQSFYSNLPGTSSYATTNGSSQDGVNDEEEFSELLAMLQGGTL